MNDNNGKPDQEQGLYRKYSVKRLNDLTGKHRDCYFFVLDLDHDPHAVAALEAYAASCAEQYPTLAFDLRHTAASAARKLGVKDTVPEERAIEQPIRELIEMARDIRNSDNYVGKVFRARIPELQALVSPQLLSTEKK